jgi:hypothetical protein
MPTVVGERSGVWAWAAVAMNRRATRLLIAE